MHFSIHGPYKLPVENRLVDNTAKSKRSFWEEVDADEDGLSYACGCYIYVIRKNVNALPWYVGLTTKRTFAEEAIGLHQVNHYNKSLAATPGRVSPELYLLAKRTPTNRFAKPSKNSHRDVEFLETFMFGVALNQNAGLRNAKNTSFLRNVVVPGIINTPQRAPTKQEKSLKRALGV